MFNLNRTKPSFLSVTTFNMKRKLTHKENNKRKRQRLNQNENKKAKYLSKQKTKAAASAEGEASFVEESIDAF